VASPFAVGALMASYGLPGVIRLMIGLLLVQIALVIAWGVEPRNRALEDVAAKAAG
jgi:putative MFS transporter